MLNQNLAHLVKTGDAEIVGHLLETFAKESWDHYHPRVVAYTDYPLNDTEYDGAVHEVEVLAYDQGLYATVKHEHGTTQIKAGYLYRDPALKRRLSENILYVAPREPGQPWGDRRVLAAVRRLARKRYHRFTVYVDQREEGSSYCEVSQVSFPFLQAAVKRFVADAQRAAREHNEGCVAVSLRGAVGSARSSCHFPIGFSACGELFFPDDAMYLSARLIRKARATWNARK